MWSRFTLRQLEYLATVCRLGSVTAAAEQLAVSPPSVSSAISQLEAEFGLPLFVRRHATGMAPTQAGLQLAKAAARTIESAKAVADLANLLRGTVQGDLTVGCLLTFAQIVLPRLRRSYTEAYPNVRFQQFQLHQAGLIEGLRDATLDVALTYDLAIPTDLEFTELAILPPFAILPETHPLASRDSLAIQELADVPMILLDLPLSADYFLALFETAGVRPQVVERAQDMAVVHSLVGNGFGFSIANTRPTFTTSPGGKALKFVPLEARLKPMRMGLLCPAGGLQPLTMRAFADTCANLLDKAAISGMTVTRRAP
jgi:DNA-binding transcriptional LysR family regulator